MAGIYNADIYCDDCIEKIKCSIAKELWHSGIGSECPDGTDNAYHKSEEDLRDYLDQMDESDYDSDSYPKWCSDHAESDCPEHCGHCAEFLENNLTTDGEDYVVEAVNESLLDGYTSSAAYLDWMPFYSHLDYYEQCADCGDYHEDLEEDLCPDCYSKYNKGGCDV